MAVRISKKRMLVADRIFKAERNQFLTQELVQVTPITTETIILGNRTQNVLGENIQKRFGFPEGIVELYAEKVAPEGVLGIKVKVMLPWDPAGKTGPQKPLPDHMSIMEPKDEIVPTTPISEQKGGKPELPAMPQPVPIA
uniref:Uncharacterized protein n=1 Tax=Pan troglodytes TaxID=9598 RepID=A0A2I3SK74_PANTR